MGTGFLHGLVPGCPLAIQKEGGACSTAGIEACSTVRVVIPMTPLAEDGAFRKPVWSQHPTIGKVVSTHLCTKFLCKQEALCTPCRGLETGTLHGRRQQQGPSGMPLGFTTTYSSMAMPDSPLTRSSIAASTTTSAGSGQTAQEQHQVRCRAVPPYSTPVAAPGLGMNESQHQNCLHNLDHPALAGLLTCLCISVGTLQQLLPDVVCLFLYASRPLTAAAACRWCRAPFRRDSTLLPPTQMTTGCTTQTRWTMKLPAQWT